VVVRSDEVICLLCGEAFRVLGRHLRVAHEIDVFEYRCHFWGALVVCEDVSRRISEVQMGNKHFLGHTFNHSEESCRRISKARLGSTQSEEACQKVRVANLGRLHSVKAKQAISKARLGKPRSEETRQSISRTLKKLWEDSDYARQMTASWYRRPNETELKMQTVLDKHFPSEWKYVGDYQVWIGGRNPDFINVNGKKQVIEVFGVYWHDSELFPNRPSAVELIAHYKNYGFDCLVLWEYDAWCDEVMVVQRVKDFDS